MVDFSKNIIVSLLATFTTVLVFTILVEGIDNKTNQTLHPIVAKMVIDDILVYSKIGVGRSVRVIIR